MATQPDAKQRQRLPEETKCRWQPAYDKLMLWHETDESGALTGKTICVVWHGDWRYVGFAWREPSNGSNRTTMYRRHCEIIQVILKGKLHRLDVTTPRPRWFSRSANRKAAIGKALFVAASVQGPTTRRNGSNLTAAREDCLIFSTLTSNGRAAAAYHKIPAWMFLDPPTDYAAVPPKPKTEQPGVGAP